MQPGLGGGYVGHYLMNRPLWRELRREDEAKGEKLVPVVGLDQDDQRLPGHHHLHLREKLLPFGMLLSRQLVIEKPSCLPPITPVLASDHRAMVPQMAWVFQGLPSTFPSQTV